MTLWDLVPGSTAPPSFKCRTCKSKTYLPYLPTVIISINALIAGLTVGRLAFRQLESVDPDPLGFPLFLGALLGSLALVVLIYVALSIGYYKYIRG